MTKITTVYRPSLSELATLNDRLPERIGAYHDSKGTLYMFQASQGDISYQWFYPDKETYNLILSCTGLDSDLYWTMRQIGLDMRAALVASLVVPVRNSVDNRVP